MKPETSYVNTVFRVTLIFGIVFGFNGGRCKKLENGFPKKHNRLGYSIEIYIFAASKKNNHLIN